MRRIWLALFALTSLWCSNRQHTNPFDPQNPDTGGQPLKLWAIPAMSGVRVHWSAPDMADREPLRLLRTRPGHGTDTLLADMPSAGTWMDHPPASGALRYTVEADVIGWSGVHRSDTSVAALSPGTCWVASGYDHLALVSPFTPSLLPSVSVGTFLVDVSSTGEVLWAAGMPGGVVYRVEASTQSPFVSAHWETSLPLCAITTSPRLNRVLLVHTDGLSWLDPAQHILEPWPATHVCSLRFGRLAPDGEHAWVWYADDSLACLSPGDATPTVFGALSRVVDLSPVSGSWCWVGSGNGLFRADPGGILAVLAQPVSAVFGMSAERCWVSLEDGTVRLVTLQGDILESRPLGGHSLCFDHDSGMLWVVAGEARLWKLSSTLETAADLDLPIRPWAVLPGPRSVR
ncbi:hypothetical protein JXA88_04430 [Candidatus Fermentibacteria bacterium]|nr:hypothetical protein [Candidatus Fermentibacteria bacterium]